MTDELDEFEDMRLSGYVKLTEQGFALPAYVARPGANAWYAALPAVEGDHASTIASFELLDDEDIIPLPDTTIIVSPGAPWQDVFLWGGRVFAGTPSQLFDALALYQDQLRALAPLSYLDLAVAAESPVSADLAAGALAFLEGKLGGAAGAASFRELVLRPGVLIELQRQYRKFGPDRLPSPLRDFILREHEPGRFEVELVPGTAVAIGGGPAAVELRASITRFGDIVGLPLRTAGLDEREPSPVLPEPPAEEPSPLLDYQTVGRRPSAEPFRSVLIIAADRRAAQIARYLEPPLEVSFGARSIWGAQTYRIEHLREFNDIPRVSRDAVISVVGTIEPDMPLDDFALVVWLAGNEALRDDRANAVLAAVRSLKPDTPFLIAPAPPSDGPSVLMEERDNSEQLLRRCNAIIDTTLARSPFWAGQPRRSVDRRMADIVATVSVVAALDSKLRAPLRDARGSKQPRALSFLGGHGRFDVERATASELNAAGLARQPYDEIHARVGFEMRERSSKRIQNAFLDLQPLRPDFEQFAEAAVVEALDPGRPWQGALSAGRDVPASILRTMDHPDLAIVVQPSDRTGQPIVVTAEAPDLRTLREAERKGASVVRYTDVDSLQALAGRDRHIPLPREMRLPTLHRYPRNRGLAARGVDTRDVFRLPETQWMELVAAHPATELEGQVRRYLAAIDTRSAEPEIALPGPAVWNAANAGDTLAEELTGRLACLRSDRALSGKRTGDLIAAWSRPADGARRWVLEDGRLPVEMTALDPNAVPAQRLFFIDGDGAVPAFLLSRLFEVWARALLPSATSWASRFQVGKTFDAFPFPWSFAIRPSENGSPAHLRFSEKNRTGAKLAELVGRNARHVAEVSEEFGRDKRGLRDHPLMREVDMLLLEDFHLPADASDLDIIELLVERNQERM
ncbi:hypothetical protein [Sphingomonas sp. LaA6.9]|uniref:hypothetical protein n=1 Tax=Sphingomonas sp. LaA6.9 TaxID=2919914 RepID=UPI001F4F83FE|nr:hypothetical protein [Sphingomonas sp. LaA6.9]MCJ8158593.1 hypothetical protein [Sphingomonas sp. LaA6.9]